MPLAPTIYSPPSGDHHSNHQQPFSAPSTVESYESHNQAEIATVPRALALNNDEVLSCSSLHSSGVLATSSSSALTPTTPTVPACSSSATAQAAMTLAPTRPTGRVVLQALETSPGEGATIAHLGGAAAGDAFSNFDDSKNRLLSPTPLPPAQAAEEATGAMENETHLSLHCAAGDGSASGSTNPTGEARGPAVDRKTNPNRCDYDHGETDDDDSSPESISLPAPLTMCVSSRNCKKAAESAELLPDAPTKPRVSMTGAGGRPKIICSPSADTPSVRRSFGPLDSITSFFQRNGSTSGLFGASDAGEKSSKKWSVLHSVRSGKMLEYDEETSRADEHGSERAKRNWRVLRAVFMALGKAIRVRVERGHSRVVFGLGQGARSR